MIEPFPSGTISSPPNTTAKRATELDLADEEMAFETSETSGFSNDELQTKAESSSVNNLGFENLSYSSSTRKRMENIRKKKQKKKSS